MRRQRRIKIRSWHSYGSRLAIVFDIANGVLGGVDCMIDLVERAAFERLRSRVAFLPIQIAARFFH